MPQCSLCEAPSKYTCPACGSKTCSASCVKQHKVQTGCSGEVDPTKFLAKPELLTAVALDRDYNFLQKISREIHVDKSDARQARVTKPRDQWRAGARIHTVGFGMSRRKRNRSRWNNTESQFEWTVQLIGSDNESQYAQLGDKTIVGDIPAKFGHAGKCVLLRNAFGERIKLPAEKTFQDAIRGKDLLEFPTLEFGSVDDSDSGSSDSSDDSSDSDSSDSSDGDSSGDSTDGDSSGDASENDSSGDASENDSSGDASENDSSGDASARVSTSDPRGNGGTSNTELSDSNEPPEEESAK